MQTPGDARFTGYQLRLFVFLSVATFFEGYDFMALAQLLPNLREHFGLSKTEGGLVVGVINAGTVAAYLLVRLADRWGRRRVLTVTIAGYTLFTVATGLAPDVYTFTAAQLVARVFLIAEWAISMVYAAEDFPAARRGMVIGVISGMSSLGAIVCAGTVSSLIQLPWGWRTVYFVGIIPLLLLAFARRNLAESSRFTAQVGLGATGRPLLYIMRSPYRKRVLQLGAIWFVTYICSHNAVTFWKDFAVNERGFTDGQVSLAVSLAAVGSMPLVFAAGPLIDRIGRRAGAVLIFGLAAVGVLLSYTLHGQWPLSFALLLGIFGAAGVMPVLNAFTTELFPTELRGDAFAWSNNILGRAGYVVSPLVVASAAEATSWGAVLSITAIFPVIAVVMIFAMLPETSSRELEDTAAL